MSATSSASSEYIPDPPGGFCILVANGGVANWVSLSGNGLLELQGTSISALNLSGDGLLRINGTNISVLNKSTSSELLNGGLGWTGTEACP
jgi:hypothetical protein